MSRNRLARSKVEAFGDWLKSIGIELLEPKGFHEVMRWKADKGLPMAMVYSKGDYESVHLTLNDSAEPYFSQWMRARKEQAE